MPILDRTPSPTKTPKIYENFDLLLEPATTGYRARVITSPVGQASSLVTLPFDPNATPEKVHLIGGAIRAYELGLADDVEPVTPLDPQHFGAHLFDAIFDGAIGVSLRRSLDLVRQREVGLRIRLQLDEAPELAALPWEYLFDTTSQRFLVLSDETPIVRYLALPLAEAPLQTVRPLRLLVMMADASDVWPRLKVAEEQARLETALRDLVQRGDVEITWLAQATLRELQRTLRQGTYHLFHFIGHGWFDATTQNNGLILENEQGLGEAVDAERLGVLLHNHPTLRLAFLNACEGARLVEGQALDGVAQHLVQQGLPAVIAMQFPVSDQAAITLAHEFYGALADHYPVDAALTEARVAIYGQKSVMEWGTPVLFMRAPDGNLWQTPSPQKAQQKVADEREGTVSRYLKRRIDAAAPSGANVGQRIDVLVQVRFPDSPILGIKDWPKTRQTPSLIEQLAAPVNLAFSVDARTGQLIPIRLKIKCETTDFQIEGPDQEIIEIAPDEESKLVMFSLRANKMGVGRIHIRVYSFDNLYLGIIPLETEILDSVIRFSVVVANLSISVGKNEDQPISVGKNEDQLWFHRQWQRVRNLWARDSVIGQVGEGATNVVIGKNNVGGRNITAYVLVIMIAALIGVGYLLYPQVDYLWNPWSMNGDFDLAIADFGLLDEQGRMQRSEFGATLSASIFHQLEETYAAVKAQGDFDLNVLIWHDDLGREDGKNIRLGYIKGATPAARSAAAKALAHRIKADMIIYGHLTEETDPESLVLEFYYETQVRAGEPDAMWGSYELGSPIAGETSYSANPEIAKRTLVNRLIPRMRALFRLSQGLAELLANQPERSVVILQTAAQELQNDWPATDGKEILYYFLGNAAAVARDYPTAINALDEALRLKADYVPALIALGGVYVDRAQLFQYRSIELSPAQAECVSLKNVEDSDPTQEAAIVGTQRAITLLERAVTLAPHSFWPPFEYRARMNLGLAYRQMGIWHFNQGDFDAADAAFTQADDAFQVALVGFPVEEQPVYYAWTQVGMGTVDRMRAHLSLQRAQNATAAPEVAKLRTTAVGWLESTIDHYQQCIDLQPQVAGNPVFRKRVLDCSCIPFQAEARQVLSATLETKE